MSVLSRKLCFFILSAHLCMAFASLQNVSLYSNAYKIGEDEDGLYGHYPTITVDQSGYGNYMTIQAAIDSVPLYNNNWIIIKVKAGTYREQVTVPKEKPYIYLKGSGKPSVTWDGHGTIQNGTFNVGADNVVVQAITFINSYNYPPEETRNPRQVAVAGMFSGDKIAVYRCAFMGWQDTLWDRTGRHYFKGCTIAGAVDFIFGEARSIYEDCSIKVNAGALPSGWAGYITAQARQSAEEITGFVFKNCHILGNGKTYLGRPWRSYATVIFYQTIMEDIIVPEGWTNIFSVINGDHDLPPPAAVPYADPRTLTFAEYECSGPGSDQSRRVPWLAKLSAEQVKWYTSLSYIDDDGWIENQPYTSTMLP